MANMQNLTLFVSSSDGYEDCWYPFFFLLRKYWPDCDLPIVLNTETKSFAFEGLNIACTKTGIQSQFGQTFHKGLEQVKTDNILLVMIDYFFMSPVITSHLREAYRVFTEERLDGIYLVDMKTITDTRQLSPNISLIAGPGQDRFSFQAAIWKKKSLGIYVLPHETPWLSEQFGSLRYQYTSDRIAFVLEQAEPFKYLHTGVLHKGGWVKEAIPFLESHGLAQDWKARGFYEWEKPTLLQRLSKRRRTAILETQSRLNLLRMKQNWKKRTRARS